MPRLSSLFIILPLFTVSLMGCTTTQQHSGFLSHYSQMNESSRTKGLYVYKNPDKSLADYNKFYIAYPRIYLLPEAAAQGVDTRQVKELGEFFFNYAVEKLGDDYILVDEPGEGVLVIRAALTDVVPAKPALNIHWATTLPGLGLGGASMEAEFVDAVSGETIVAVMDSREGKRYKKLSGLSKWGHAKDVMKKWIHLLKDRLDETR